MKKMKPPFVFLVVLAFGFAGLNSVEYPLHSQGSRTQATELDVALLSQWAASIIPGLPIPSTVVLGNANWTPAQMLYGLAYLYAAQQTGMPLETIEIPTMLGAPETYGLLQELGCSDCLDTAWSLKPARFQRDAP